MDYENYNDHVRQNYRSGINKYMLSLGFEKSVHHKLLKEFAITILNKENINGNTAKQTLQLYASQDFNKFKQWLTNQLNRTEDEKQRNKKRYL